ncbi:MAG: T9SS type A sorting domain-containing protein [Bacteroidia bacterium]
MKKALVSFLFTWCCAFFSIAQPNGGFEDWISGFNTESPVSWQTLNFLQFTMPPNPVSAFKAGGIDKHSGNYALKLKSIYLNNNPAPNILDDTMGLTFTGYVNIAPTYYRYGFPYTGRPQHLDFWYKYLPVGADEGGVRVVLTKWTGTKQDTVGFAETELFTNSFYSLYQLPITYFKDELPDTAAIFFASSRHRDVARNGTVLYLDDVVFTGWVGMDEKDAVSVNVYPNPAKEHITLSGLDKRVKEIQITDIAGKLIGTYPVSTHSAIEVNTSSFAEGTYLYTILAEPGKVLSKGKFSVVR